jgi:antitoxin component of MazEF toxin-antitoxin module
MPIVIKSSNEDSISLPLRLMKELNLDEGDEVKATFDGQSLRLTRLDKFLALRGSLADDEEFDKGIEFLNEAWESWIPLTSA